MTDYPLLRSLTPDEEKDLNNRFTFHPSESRARQILHEDVREGCLNLAEEITRSSMPCRELSLAITKIEEAMFWANAAVARLTEDGARR